MAGWGGGGSSSYRQGPEVHWTEVQGSLQRQRARLGVRRLGFQLVSVALGQAHHLSVEWDRTTFHQLLHRMVGVSGG